MKKAARFRSNGQDGACGLPAQSHAIRGKKHEPGVVIQRSMEERNAQTRKRKKTGNCIWKRLIAHKSTAKFTNQPDGLIGHSAAQRVARETKRGQENARV